MLLNDFNRTVALNNARHAELLADARTMRMLAKESNVRPTVRRNVALSFLRAVVNTILHPQRFRSQTV